MLLFILIDDDKQEQQNNPMIFIFSVFDFSDIKDGNFQLIIHIISNDKKVSLHKFLKEFLNKLFEKNSETMANFITISARFHFLLLN